MIRNFHFARPGCAQLFTVPRTYCQIFCRMLSAFEVCPEEDSPAFESTGATPFQAILATPLRPCFVSSSDSSVSGRGQVPLVAGNGQPADRRDRGTDGRRPDRREIPQPGGIADSSCASNVRRFTQHPSWIPRKPFGANRSLTRHPLCPDASRNGRESPSGEARRRRGRR